jgi:WD40 repeat protein
MCKNNLLIIFLFTNLLCIYQSFGMDQKKERVRKIPSLSELALNAAKPQVEAHITTTLQDKSEANKLQQINDLLGHPVRQISDFVHDHPSIKGLVQAKAVQKYDQAVKSRTITLSRHTMSSSIPFLDKQIELQLRVHCLKENFNFPTCSHDPETNVYAACQFNNGFVFAPLKALMNTIHSAGKIDLNGINEMQDRCNFALQAHNNGLARLVRERVDMERMVKQVALLTQYRLLSPEYLFQGEMPQINYNPSDIELNAFQSASYAINNESFSPLSILASFDAIYSLNKDKVAIKDRNNITVYSLNDSTVPPIVIPLQPFQSDACIDSCFSIDGEMFLMTCGKKIYAYDFNQETITELHTCSDTQLIMAIHPRANNKLSIVYYDAASDSLNLYSFDIYNKKWKVIHQKSLQEVAHVANARFSPDGKLIAIACENGKVLLLDSATFTIIKELCHEDQKKIDKMMFSQDNTILTTITGDYIVSTWHCASGQRLKQFSFEIMQNVAGSINDTITITQKKQSCFTGRYHNYDKSKIEKLAGTVNYNTRTRLPIILLNFPFDKERFDIAMLCDKSSNAWQKTFNTDETMLQKIFESCSSVADLEKFQESLAENRSTAQDLLALYVFKVSKKIDELLQAQDEVRLFEQERQEKMERVLRAISLYIPNWSFKHIIKIVRQLDDTTKSLIIEKMCKEQNPYVTLVKLSKQTLDWLFFNTSQNDEKVIYANSDAKNTIDVFYILRDYYMRQRRLGLSLEDYLRTNQEQRKCLHNVLDGDYEGDIKERYKMTRANIDVLLPIKDIIEKTKKLHNAPIQCDISPKTKSDEIKDILTIAVPLGIAHGVVPFMLTRDEQYQGLWGSAVNSGISLVIGGIFLPLCDFFNYDTANIRKWFGISRVAALRKGKEFAFMGFFHFGMNALAEQLLSWKEMPYQILGYASHGLRLAWYGYDVYELMAEQKNKNNIDKFTLGDLLQAQG